mgnify:CR=1 FL=1
MKPQKRKNDTLEEILMKTEVKHNAKTDGKTTE